MKIDIETTLPVLDVSRENLYNTVRHILQGEGQNNAAVTIVLVDDPYIRKLNHKYRQLNRATDVLSFNLNDELESNSEELGDVYISVARAREQAYRYRISMENELHRLLIHGCLHLLGYDHKNSRDRKEMRDKEQFYFRQNSSMTS